jgi:hypothetical protein
VHTLLSDPDSLNQDLDAGNFVLNLDPDETKVLTTKKTFHQNRRICLIKPLQRTSRLQEKPEKPSVVKFLTVFPFLVDNFGRPAWIRIRIGNIQKRLPV